MDSYTELYKTLKNTLEDLNTKEYSLKEYDILFEKLVTIMYDINTSIKRSLRLEEEKEFDGFIKCLKLAGHIRLRAMSLYREKEKMESK